MKDTKTVQISFAFYDRANLERFLEEQAAEGWLIVTYAPNFLNLPFRGNIHSRLRRKAA